MRLPNVFIRGADADPSAELPQHVDAEPSVRRIHHQMHCAIRFEHAAQGCESRIRVLKMMEDSGADNLVEGFLQFVQTIDGELADLKIR